MKISILRKIIYTQDIYEIGEIKYHGNFYDENEDKKIII